MKLNKLLNVFKNADQILEGIKNNIFKTEDIEKIAKHRWEICDQCEFIDREGSHCVAPGSHNLVVQIVVVHYLLKLEHYQLNVLKDIGKLY
jgi:hypothetical protein